MVRRKYLVYLCLVVVCITLAMMGCRNKQRGVQPENITSSVPAVGKISNQEVAKAIVRAGAITGESIAVDGGITRGIFL